MVKSFFPLKFCGLLHADITVCVAVDKSEAKL